MELKQYGYLHACTVCSFCSTTSSQIGIPPCLNVHLYTYKKVSLIIKIDGHGPLIAMYFFLALLSMYGRTLRA